MQIKYVIVILIKMSELSDSPQLPKKSAKVSKLESWIALILVSLANFGVYFMNTRINFLGLLQSIW